MRNNPGEPEWLPGVDNRLSELTGEQLEREMLGLAGHLAAAQARFLALIGEFDERRLWQDWEALSAAHWLAWRCGVGLHAAREQVRVARCLRKLPLIAEAFGRGELSYSKVRAITRAANLETQEGWINLARYATATMLETAVARFRRWGGTCLDDRLLADDEDASLARRSFQWNIDENGDMVARVRIPRSEREQFLAAIDSAMVTEPAEGERLDPVEVRRADALLARVAAGAAVDESLAEPARVNVHITVPATAATAAALSQPGGVTGESRASTTEVTATSAGCPSCDGQPSGDDAGLEALAGGVTGDVFSALASSGRWPVHDGAGQAMSMQWLEQVIDDASIQLVLDVIDEASGDLLTSLDLGRAARLPNRALRRAVMRRDGGSCRFPGCTQRHRLQIHHIIFWEHGGPTDLANLILLCPTHHGSIHRRGWSIMGDASNAQFVRPDGAAAPDRAEEISGSLAALMDQHQRYGLDIAADGAGSLWMGDSIDWACFFAGFASGPAAAEPPVWDVLQRKEQEERAARWH